LPEHLSTAAVMPLETKTEPAPATLDLSNRRWLSQAQAANYLGVTDRTLRAYAARGVLRAHRIRGSRLIRYDRSELDAALRPIPSARGGAV